MQYSNEIKVGLTLVLAAAVFYFGIRYLRNLPLFQGSYVLETRFTDAGGLVPGNAVRINGVNVGSVESVTLNEEARKARVLFRVDKGIKIPEGSTASITGVSALGGVRLNITLGPPSNPPIPPGGFVPSPPEADVLDQLSDRVPILAARADSLLRIANSTMSSANRILSSPDSDFRAILQSLRTSANTLTTILQEQRDELRQTLQNTQVLTEELRAFAAQNTDSLGLAVTNLNRVLNQAEHNLTALQHTTTNLNQLIQKINSGDGTLSRLVNDPSLYVHLDSTAAKLNSILDDFQQNPGRYLKDMSIVRVF